MKSLHFSHNSREARVAAIMTVIAVWSMLLMSACAKRPPSPAWMAPAGYTQVSHDRTATADNFLWIDGRAGSGCWLVEARELGGSETLGSVSACSSKKTTSAALILESIVGVVAEDAATSVLMTPSDGGKPVTADVHDQVFLAPKGAIGKGDRLIINIMGSQLETIASVEVKVT
ncbi:hypothetical protein [Verrucosispora sioxanthis]|uniref:Uncharacterized protein n=1 Tax=Verrucosispora sioxanthis TaxID=2499994 RepID=A0A6M1L3D9_9ACTN|nr:hypothetical protein [Verrucosispora sioxanthis]NEE63270.1 hypothetical protein [Verrucosispora sioxanthis]NGM12380.1 hypothetical protein [Verrucosispora sioxanthis]